MALAIFDLDNTLIAGDSDHGWGEVLASRGKVDAANYRAMNETFDRYSQQARFDIHEDLAVAIEPVARLPGEELVALHREFMVAVIEPMWLPRAVQLVQHHRERGDRLMVITSTHRCIAEPICRRLGIRDL